MTRGSLAGDERGDFPDNFRHLAPLRIGWQFFVSLFL